MQGGLRTSQRDTGRFDGELRYPGEDDVYKNPKMDALKLQRFRLWVRLCVDAT